MMFERILTQMEPIDLSDAELEQVVSKDNDGNNVTIADLIDDVAPKTLALFGRKTRGKHPEIKPVRALDDKEIKDIVDVYLNDIPKDEALAVAGYGSFTADQLRREVNQQTEIGQHYIDSVRQHNAFLEEAIKLGKVQLKVVRSMKIPEFDF